MAPLSILESVKKNLNLPPDYDEFDQDVIIAINTGLSTMTQIGVGPPEGFQITGADETWDALLGTDPRLNPVINYVSLQARLIFDPPATSFAITAIQDQLREMVWRLEVIANPAPALPPDIIVIEDF